ncbi:VOC family protein [Streptomyces kunmingensis]|uniref:VOC family protein n=1 Tax=Streptomyces kunmingensis TaxID=68225 RepID=A0ABU6CKZ3_9ACTN|nr:VOC family protein [Streptomyces kunmingensis]MEB3965104.1 VOC family protein [Streptomyces kunmingensis]
MLNHVEIQTTDVQASAAFYDAVLAPLGVGRRIEHEGRIGYGDERPEFWIGPVPDSTGSQARESHLAFTAPDRSTVDAFHKGAVAVGAEVLHAPKVWPQYHDTYYAAFVRDPDGNNIEAVCERPE